MSNTFFRIGLVCSAALVTAMCSGGNSTLPTAPSPANPPVATQPGPTPAPTPAPAPQPPSGAAPGRLEFYIAPNPVPWSGVPITDSAGCASVANTWYYDMVLIEVGGQTVTLKNRVDVFDGKPTNNLSNLNIVIPAYTRTQIRARWCASANVNHVAQTTFSGTDASNNEVKVTSPSITMMPR